MGWFTEGFSKRKAADEVEERLWEAKTKARWRKDGESEKDIAQTASDWFQFGGEGKPEKKKGWWD